jgi:hypothetical protein
MLPVNRWMVLLFLSIMGPFIRLLLIVNVPIRTTLGAPDFKGGARLGGFVVLWPAITSPPV